MYVLQCWLKITPLCPESQGEIFYNLIIKYMCVY